MYSILESNNNFFFKKKEEKEKSWVMKRKVKSQVTSKLPRTKYKRLVLVKTAVNCGLGGVWNPLHLTPNWERSRVQNNNDC